MMADACLCIDSQVNSIIQADACKVTPAKFSGSKKVVPLHFRSQFVHTIHTSHIRANNGRLKTLNNLRQVRVDSQTVMVYRCGRWAKLLGTNLLPGDVVSIGRLSTHTGGEDKTVPADMVLLFLAHELLEMLCHDILEKLLPEKRPSHQWITTTASFHARGYTSPLRTIVSPRN
uniref:Uncharacterized protein n=1 Tax=Brassica oleracea TaxID=3712 RepID=A0A3P6EFI3_BRAOL|nr:unnamed protein product [Brassica oleracea]